MRLHYLNPTLIQKTSLRNRWESLHESDRAIQLIQHVLPAHRPQRVVCVSQDTAPDRFVVRVEAQIGPHRWQSFAFKGYADDRGERIWALYSALAKQWQSCPEPCPVCLPLAYLPDDRLLIFPWISGHKLLTALEHGNPHLLRRAAATLASLHGSGVVPEAATTAPALVDATLKRSEKICQRWPTTAELVRPLMDDLSNAASCLVTGPSALVHGDLDLDQFICADDKLVLLDLDMFGYAAPAYDAGHFLAQMWRRAAVNPTRDPIISNWMSIFREAYLEVMSGVAPINIWFYLGLTLLRKIYTVCNTDGERWQQTVPRMAAAAEEAFRRVQSAR